jgi:gamma-glutamyltranspeptidase/glutathione hydrolase
MPVTIQPSSFSTTQTTTKHAPVTQGGVVSAQHAVAARIGAEVLAAGGDAVDAAVAVSFAIGVVEPWMSGPAGGGAMMLWRADEGRAHALNYGMRAPAGLDPADYPLSGAGKTSDLFPWDAVVDDRNVHGATAVAVPGLVDGVGQAHARFGRMPWEALLQPAIDLAREGMAVDWYAAMMIAGNAEIIARDPDAARVFLEDGKWAPFGGWTALSDKRLDFGAMADTLDRVARHGYREFFDGEVGEALAADIEAKGGPLRHEDLRAYRAAFHDPLSFAYRDARFDVMPGLTAGPTFRAVFAGLEQALAPGEAPGANAYVAYAAALKAAYAERLSKMGDENEAPTAPASTTHFSIVDRTGNMVALTQTLLSAFGSKTVSPSTGLMLNNGIMWFDPVQGRANSLSPGKRCLMNVCPVIGAQGARRFAFGASGGRKIVSAVAQLSSFVIDFGMDVGQAFHQPRIDVSGAETVVADSKVPADAIAALGGVHPVTVTHRTIYPYAFACPAGVLRDGDTNSGCTEIMTPWGDSACEEDCR